MRNSLWLTGYTIPSTTHGHIGVYTHWLPSHTMPFSHPSGGQPEGSVMLGHMGISGVMGVVVGTIVGTTEK